MFAQIPEIYRNIEVKIIKTKIKIKVWLWIQTSEKYHRQKARLQSKLSVLD